MTDIAPDFARCFSTPAGARVLEYLRTITIERTLGTNASDNELRWAEAQRAFLRQILSLVARGRGDKS